MNSKPGSELEWLLYHLWLKTGPAPPQFIFTIADTVFYRKATSSSDVGIPECWYFSSKDGYILKKNRFNVSTKEIHKAFTKKLESHDQIAGVALYQERDPIQCYTNLHLQHMPPSDFRALLFSSPAIHESLTMPGNTPYALQKFIPSKQIKHTVYRCSWNSKQGYPLIEKLQNLNSFFDGKVPLEERIPTLEQNTSSHLTVQTELNSVPQQIADSIVRSLRQIQEHLLLYAQVELLNAKIYFKVDRKTDNLALFFVHNLAVQGESPNCKIGCLGETHQVRIKSWKRKQTIEAPPFESDITAFPRKLQYSSRPASNYTSSIASVSKKCPFCENPCADGANYEITVNQVLKFQKFLRKSQKEVPSNPFCRSISNSVDLVPEALMRAFPSLNNEKFNKRRQDPLFLYDTLRLCDDCYSVMKDLLTETQQSKKTPIDDKPASIRTIHTPAFPQVHAPLQKKEENTLKVSQIISKEEIKRGDLLSVGGSLKESESLNQPVHQRNFADLQQKSSLSSVKASVYQKITGIDDEMRQTFEKKKDEPMVMMFSKVEKGKEVAESLVRYQKDNEKLEVVEKLSIPQLRQASEKLIERRLQKNSVSQTESLRSDEELYSKRGRPRQSKERASTQQNLIGAKLKSQKEGKRLPKIGWEKNYQDAIKEKTRLVKDDIMDTCDKLERNEFVLETSPALLPYSESQDKWKLYHPPSSQNIVSLNFDRKETNPEVVHESRMFENLTPMADREKQQAEQIVTQKKRRMQPNNVRQQKPQALQAEIIAKRKSSVERVDSTSPSDRRPSQKRLLSAYGFPKVAIIPSMSAKSTTTVPRQRPQSSKPPLHVIYNTAALAPLTHKQHTDDTLEFRGRKSSKHQSSLRPKNAQQPSKAEAPPLLDFNNMTEDHIKQIAEKADQLIEIIQNIKDKVGTKRPEEEPNADLPASQANQEGNSWWS